MHKLDDHALLRQYVEQNSEAAFAALVARHVDKVYSVALRHTRQCRMPPRKSRRRSSSSSREKSGRLGGNVILTGWLYQTARLTAATFIRREIRRARREQEAYMQTALNENESDSLGAHRAAAGRRDGRVERGRSPRRRAAVFRGQEPGAKSARRWVRAKTRPRSA